MAKKRKQVDTISIAKPEDVPEDEQWRIVEQTGILKNIPRNAQARAVPENDDFEEGTPFCNEIFNAALLVIPFSSLYIMMDILGHRQYGQIIKTGHLLEDVLWGIPVLSLFIFYTTRYKTDRRMQILLFLLSVGCGCRLIHVVNWESWKTVMKQCPPLGTIWVYTIVQLDLLWAVAALSFVAVFVQWKDLKIIF